MHMCQASCVPGCWQCCFSKSNSRKQRRLVLQVTAYLLCASRVVIYRFTDVALTATCLTLLAGANMDPAGILLMQVSAALPTLLCRYQHDPNRYRATPERHVEACHHCTAGANMIPADILPTRATPERYADLVNSAVAAHMNMIRVWGGGIYPPRQFYDLCDEAGLLVWQEAIFACSVYPRDKAFLSEVRPAQLQAAHEG